MENMEGMFKQSQPRQESLDPSLETLAERQRKALDGIDDKTLEELKLLLTKPGAVEQFRDRVKKAFLAITAGLLFMSSMPALGADGRQGESFQIAQSGSMVDTIEKQRETIQREIQKLQEEKVRIETEQIKIEADKRKEKYESKLRTFNVTGLRLGEPKNRARCPCEQFGLYLKDKHLGDIYSEGHEFFTMPEFLQDVTQILRENGIEATFSFEFNISLEAKSLMAKMGYSYSNGKFDFRGKFLLDFTMDGKTQSVRIEAKGEVIVITVTNIDGTVEKAVVLSPGEVVIQ